jgi:hypothetical protein
MSYTLIHSDEDGSVSSITSGNSGMSIPPVAGNRHYDEFVTWNDAQPSPLSLDPITPPTRMVPKASSALHTEIEALPQADKDKLMCECMTQMLQGQPDIGISGLGIPIIGHEAEE